MSARDIADRLRRIVGEQYVLMDEQSVEDYGRDAFNWARLRAAAGAPQTPFLVLRPQTTEQVRDIILLCNETRTPIVPYGSGTGVMGAAISLERGVVLDMSRMGKILRISTEDRTATVQPGIVLGDLDQALNAHGLMLGHDPWSQPIASVGGAVSTNGQGYIGAGYGSMGEQVLGLEAVMPTGEVLRSKALPKQSTGPDFKHLLIGGEGVFGVITEVTLRAHPLPEERRMYGVRFPCFPDGFHAVCDMFALGLRPAMVDLSEKGDSSVLPAGDFPTVLYMVLDGFREWVEAQEKRALAICRTHSGELTPHDEPATYWKERHSSAEWYIEARAGGVRHPWSRGAASFGSLDYLQPALPISKVLEYRQKALPIFEEARMEVRESSIWGTPEMFCLVVADPTARTPEDFKRTRAATDAALQLAQDMGGNMEHVHGVGLRLIHLMERELGPDTFAVAKRIKAALDPNNIMNPGKLYR